MRLGTRRWYVVYTKRYKEECAQFHLKQKGVETFFPRLLLPRSTARHERIVPLFPGYLFACLLMPEEYECVRWLPGVKYLVGFYGAPVPLEDEIVVFLRQRSNAEGILTARLGLKPGQEVRISSGPFEGLVGIIENPPNAGGRVKVLMELLNRRVKVEVPIQYIEYSWMVAGGEGK
jgi:transcriptional antiterminator NusG